MDVQEEDIFLLLLSLFLDIVLVPTDAGFYGIYFIPSF
jgi:hypothetical protein